MSCSFGQSVRSIERWCVIRNIPHDMIITCFSFAVFSCLKASFNFIQYYSSLLFHSRSIDAFYSLIKCLFYKVTQIKSLIAILITNYRPHAPSINDIVKWLTAVDVFPKNYSKTFHKVQLMMQQKHLALHMLNYIIQNISEIIHKIPYQILIVIMNDTIWNKTYTSVLYNRGSTSIKKCEYMCCSCGWCDTVMGASRDLGFYMNLHVWVVHCLFVCKMLQLM